MDLLKTCNACKKEQPYDQFIQRTTIKHKPTKMCQSCRDRSLAKAKGKPDYGVRQKAYYYANRERYLVKMREWRLRQDTSGASYYSRRSALDPAYKETQRLSRLTSSMLKTKKRSRRGEVATGCTAQELRAHIERLFQPGMTWANYGGRDGWSIDHIFPLSVAARHSKEALARAALWPNIQPMWRKENKAKHTALPAEWPSVEEFLKSTSFWGLQSPETML